MQGGPLRVRCSRNQQAGSMSAEQHCWSFHWLLWKCIQRVSSMLDTGQRGQLTSARTLSPSVSGPPSTPPAHLHAGSQRSDHACGQRSLLSLPQQPLHAACGAPPQSACSCCQTKGVPGWRLAAVNDREQLLVSPCKVNCASGLSPGCQQPVWASCRAPTWFAAPTWGS